MKSRSQRPAEERQARSRAVKHIAENPLLRGSLVSMARTCGKAGCRCQQVGGFGRPQTQRRATHPTRPRPIGRPRAGRRVLHSRRAVAVPREEPPPWFRPVSDCCPGDSPLFSRFRALHPPWKMPLLCFPGTRTAQGPVFRAFFFRRYPTNPQLRNCWAGVPNLDKGGGGRTMALWSKSCMTAPRSCVPAAERN